MSQLPQIKIKGTLANKTYETLKTAIINHDLHPGKMITEEEISEQLGVSRTPIRTALTKLMYEGLIEMIPGKGTFVTRLSTQYFMDLFIVREALESLSFSIAAEKRTKEDLKNIKSLLDYQYDILNNEKNERKAVTSFLNADVEFHKTVAKISRNECLERQISIVMESWSRYLFSLSLLSCLKEAIAEHKNLYDALEEGNPQKAKLYIKEHTDSTKNRGLIYLKNNDDIL